MKNIPGLMILCCMLVLTPVFPEAFAELHIDTSSSFVYPEFSKTISMDFQQAPLVDVLKIFSQQTNLNLIASEALSDKKVTVYLDEVPVEQALEQILRANGLTYELQPNSNIFIVKPLAQPEVELITRVYPLRHASVQNSKINDTLTTGSDEESSSTDSASGEESGITSVIAEILTPQGKVIEDPRTNSLIITDIATNFDVIERTLDRLDSPVVQVMIEVEMLELSKTTADLLGVKIGSSPLSFTGAVRSHVYPWNQNDLIARGDITQPTYTTGTIDASGLTAVLQMLKTQSDTKSLARPKILTLNNQKAEIKIATDEAIGARQTSSSDGGLSTVEAERVETGVFLTVTPQANPETNEITMAVVPKVIIARTGGSFLGTTFRDPEERGSKSLLRVHSGETIVIGGLMREDLDKTLTKVPVLGDIPLIGGAFRHTDSELKDRELVIFLTPHIIRDQPSGSFTQEQTRVLVREQDPVSIRQDAIEREMSEIKKN